MTADDENVLRGTFNATIASQRQQQQQQQEHAVSRKIKRKQVALVRIINKRQQYSRPLLKPLSSASFFFSFFFSFAVFDESVELFN